LEEIVMLKTLLMSLALALTLLSAAAPPAPAAGIQIDPWGNP
jgi:hypothetical protein